MRITDLIQRDRIIPKLKATSKHEIIRELAKHLSTSIEGVVQEDLFKVLSDRESLASTAIGDGVAIPHGKISGVETIFTCIGRARDGVDFSSIDGKPTYLFIVMIAPESSTGVHLKALARISRVFKDGTFVRKLLEAPGADEMYNLLCQEDEKY